MLELITAARMKEIDRIAIQERGIPSTLLMERAARALADQVLALVPPEPGNQPSAVVFCGPGNNGGDGIAAARFLLQDGWNVRCILVGNRDKMTDDSREMERRLADAGGALEQFDFDNQGKYTGYDVAVDALFGIGLNSDLRPDTVEAVKLMKFARWIVSADIPSGVHADTGKVFSGAVPADVTVTFSAAKPGLYVGEGAAHAGRIVVADIGIPQDLLKSDCGVSVAPKPSLRRRPRNAHKGRFGKLFILAGSVGYTGAPVLASRAAVRSGAGLIYLAVPEQVYPIVAVKCDEAMVWPWAENYEEILAKAKGSDAVLLGPGLGQSERAEMLVLSLMRDLTCPVILDADGLNIVAKHIDVLDKRQGITVLTPHDGEFARLSGCTLPVEDRLTAAMDFAEKHHCVLVLKGHRTITADSNRRCTVNTTGNPGMARGGSGDALAGLMAGLLVQYLTQNSAPLNAVSDAVWLHGRAGDLAAADKGEYGMSVCDLIEQIPYAMKECEEE